MCLSRIKSLKTWKPPCPVSKGRWIHTCPEVVVTPQGRIQSLQLCAGLAIHLNNTESLPPKKKGESWHVAVADDVAPCTAARHSQGTALGCSVRTQIE